MKTLLTFLTVGLFAAAPTPPEGFKALFNGEDLTGWVGGDTADYRAYLALPPEKREARDKAWTEDMRKHWKVVDGELVNDGHGKYATTDKEYGDIELLLEYNMAPLGDSGVYLRNVPQVQIWDPNNEKEFKNGAQKGSGGLWNYSPGSPGKDPLVLADNKPGEWNTLRVIMVGSRVTVWLNGKLTVDHAILENYYNRKLCIPAKGPLNLQTHGAPIRWRNLFIREIGGEEANRYLASKNKEGFYSIFDGKTFNDWRGAVDQYKIEDGAIYCMPHKGGNLYHKDDLTDFVARLEFKLPPGGNNGLCIRYPGKGDTAYVGMCECQVLDDNYELNTHSKIDPRQAHGSAYGMVAAQRGYQRPLGQWNFEEVTVKGSTIKCELNGYLILDADLSKVDLATVMGKAAHPGKDRTNGFFGFAGHNDPVGFREIYIKRLDGK